MVTTVFVTHHHSDHLISLDDLAITRWMEWSEDPVPVVVPEGPGARYARRCMDLWADDIAVRQEHTGRSSAPAVSVTAFEPSGEPQVVWERDGVTVSAVMVRHQPVEPAVAYRVDTPDGSVVISGDTRVCEEVEQLATGADVLVHEVALVHALDGTAWEVLFDYHADSTLLGGLAKRAGVKTLMLTHFAPFPNDLFPVQRFVDDVRAGGFDGELVAGDDLSSVTLG